MGVVLALVVIVAGAGVVIWRSTSAEAGGDPVISVSRSACGQGWTDPRPGPQSFQVHNTGSVTAEVELIDPGTGTVFGEVDGLGAGTTRSMRVTLGNGAYAFRCVPEETDPIVGPTATVGGGQERSGPAVVPVTRNDLLAALRTYKDYAGTGLSTLSGQTGALSAAVRSGDRGASEAAWLTAHLAYERLGAAYDAFGDSNGAINGTADGLPAGVTDEGFTGFHRLEQGLWHGQDMAALAAVADRLDADVRKLRDSFADLQIDPNDLGLRAHEIMENTLQFELTGRTDYGSGTNLATALANLDGTREVLTVLRPLLVPRFPDLSEVDNWIGRTDAALRTAQRPDGTWTPVAQLARAQRERINGAVGELTELLAPVAAITEPRRVS
ncbi:EfeM/EfeO family lipoprotein [Amycolatopsis sp. K13G38]|uniref:EfeM/EfeO family lipoprotein n=1 Tax=Amycolatopsis acididurans TaxID=2724524 RepID=A0ABX1IYL1_9PSEU|nr:EfeM/EfeO family lipoprotein [Amycolatopsis acididurans]